MGHVQGWAGSLKSRQHTIKTKLSEATKSQPNYQNIHNHIKKYQNRQNHSKIIRTDNILTIFKYQSACTAFVYSLAELLHLLFSSKGLSNDSNFVMQPLFTFIPYHVLLRTYLPCCLQRLGEYVSRRMC